MEQTPGYHQNQRQVESNCIKVTADLLTWDHHLRKVTCEELTATIQALLE